MSQWSWLVAGIVPGIERHPLKKLDPDEEALLQLIQRWRDEAVRAGRPITRIALAFEAGRDGFWLARWLRMRGIESFVIHSTSVAVPHTFAALTDSSAFLVAFQPAGAIEQLFAAAWTLSKSQKLGLEEWKSVAAPWGVEIVGPSTDRLS